MRRLFSQGTVELALGSWFRQGLPQRKELPTQLKKAMAVPSQQQTTVTIQPPRWSEQTLCLEQLSYIADHTIARINSH